MSNDDFEIAKKVAEPLKSLQKDRQERILRWVAESLGLVTATRMAGAEPAQTVTGIVTTVPGQPTGRAIDIKSFVDAKDPKSDQQFAAVVAYYYRFEAPVDERRDTITAEVLQNAARLAGRARLTAPLKTLNNAKSQGYLDSPERGAFRINSVGENLVAMTLPGSVSESKPARRRRKVANTKAKAKRGGSRRGSR